MQSAAKKFQSQQGSVTPRHIYDDKICRDACGWHIKSKCTSNARLPPHLGNAIIGAAYCCVSHGPFDSHVYLHFYWFQSPVTTI